MLKIMNICRSCFKL